MPCSGAWRCPQQAGAPHCNPWAVRSHISRTDAYTRRTRSAAHLTASHHPRPMTCQQASLPAAPDEATERPRRRRTATDGRTPREGRSSKLDLFSIDIEATICTCKTAQQLSTLAEALAQLPKRATPSRHPDSWSQMPADPLTGVPSQYAILILQRLGELYPSASVRASVVLQPAYPFNAPFPVPDAPSPSTEPQGAAVSSDTASQPEGDSAQSAGSRDSAAGAQTGAEAQSAAELLDQWGVGLLEPTDAAPGLLKPAIANTQPSRKKAVQLRRPPDRPLPPPATPPSPPPTQPSPPGHQQTGYTSQQSGLGGLQGGGNGAGGGVCSVDEHTKRVAALADSLVACVMRRGLSVLQPLALADFLSALACLGYPNRRLTAQVTEYMALSGALQGLQAHPSALVNALWAVAKLGHDPGAKWISYFLYTSRPVIDSFSAVDCAACCWALARLKFRPGQPWLHSLYDRITVVSRQLGPQGVVNVAWGLAMLKVPVPRPLAETLMIEAQVLFEIMTATGLATLCWALASLQHRPPGFWAEGAMATLVHKMSTIPTSARGLPYANAVWALSVWETVQPTPAWFNAFCRHVTRSLPSMSSRNLAVVLLGFADLGHTPDQKWVSLALEEFHKRGVDQADPASLVAVLWGVSRLLRPADAQGGAEARAWRPPRPWLLRYAHILQDLADAVAAQFKSLTPPDLVDVLVALADLRYHPGQRWLDLHTACCNVCIQEFSAYQVQLMNNALKALSELSDADYLPRKGELV